jgi:hypothetical protein
MPETVKVLSTHIIERANDGFVVEMTLADHSNLETAQEWMDRGGRQAAIRQRKEQVLPVAELVGNSLLHLAIGRVDAESRLTAQFPEIASEIGSHIAYQLTW